MKAGNEKIKTFAERLRIYRNLRGLGQSEMGKLLGVEGGTISLLETEKRQPGGPLMLLFELLEQSPLYQPTRVLSESATYGGAKKKPESDLAMDPPAKTRKIPILSWAQAGVAVDYETLPIDPDDMEDYSGTDTRAYALRVKGDSMSPDFPPGTIITVSPQYPPSNKNIVVAGLKDKGAVLKEFHHSGDHKMVTLISFNPDYETIIRPREDFHFIHRVVASHRKH